ncbi:type I restriction-modification system subunit M [Peribacillus frigoritolerans]|uniref:type I restriction-modification system subunit M n=1 Tax=Peribacillus frigoritolerans TaxID=450367 RepID=UPI0025A1CE9E|nr:class I SAM-dependent DNA methyltransferase [Peribacillus frigoritolerans]MDM5309703.1 class I SAM-dependent DNA methyltransferase [Peribacillus frigoritolerans]
MLNPELQNKIDFLWDCFRRSGISDPLIIIEQISYMLFIKNLEIKESEFKELGIEDDFFIPKDYRWSNFSKYPVEELFQVVADRIFPFIKSEVLSKFMRDAVFEISNPALLGQVVEVLNSIDSHVKGVNGELYECFLKNLSSSGSNYGQLYTPRHVIDMVVKMMEPAPGEMICDPACGTGGFLVSSAKFMSEKYKNKKEIDDIFTEQALTGLDINLSMLKISTMNLLMHDITISNIDYINVLSSQFNVQKQYDLVLTNPPFNGILHSEDIHPWLEGTVRTKRTELLFLALTFRILREGGRCAIIVPEGILHAQSRAHKTIRRLLVDDHCLEAIVSLPNGVFKPYASISTSVLIFSKKGTTGKVWYYEMTSDGFTLDNKRNPLEESDVSDIVSQWGSCKTQKNSQPQPNDKWFWVDKEDIKKMDWNLSISQYKKINYKETFYESPSVILDRIEKSEKEIMELIIDLRGRLTHEE